MSDQPREAASETLAETLAGRLAAAERDGVPVAPLAEITAGDIDAAYAVQRASTDRWLATGRRIVGRKIGITSPQVQAQLGVDQPDYGVLFDDMRYPSGSTVPFTRVLQPRIEAEVAFHLVADLTDVDAVGDDTVRAAIGPVAAALEIVGSRIADWKITITDTIADNASSGAFVLGDSVELGDLDPAEVTMELTRTAGGVTEVVSAGRGSDCLGSPVLSTVWLARELARRGTPLRRGDVVLTGALGPMVPVRPGDSFRATVAPVGTVEVNFA